jgi:hypothetical protein
MRKMIMHKKFWSDILSGNLDVRKMKMYIRKIVCEKMDWIPLALDRVQWRASVPSSSIKAENF